MGEVEWGVFVDVGEVDVGEVKTGSLYLFSRWSRGSVGKGPPEGTPTGSHVFETVLPSF